MELNWYHSEGNPSTLAEVNLDWSTKNVYLHKNIVEVEKEDEQGNTYKIFEYDECRLSNDDYARYIGEKEEKTRSDVDYIAMMTDVDLEV